MPLPLLAIGIGLGVSAVSGIAQLAGNRRIARDKERFEQRHAIYESRRLDYEKIATETKGNLDALHKQRVAALGTLRQAADFLDRAKVKDREWDASFKITPERFAEIKSVTVRFSDIAMKLGVANVGAGAAGVGAAAGAYAAVGAFGTASTGAAISGLSGIAARNATLAWLGGGSLTSGGGGMAAGMASLTSIALAPLAIIPPIVSWTRAVRQSNRIDEAIAEMDVNEAKFGVHMAKLTALRELSREMSKAISEVKRALKDILRLASPDKLEDIYRVACAAKALADLLDKNKENDMTIFSAPMGSQAAMGIISAAVEYMRIHESEQTRREYIRAQRDILVTALNNQQEFILAYFEHRFAERRSALEEFYALLRESVDGGDTARLQAALAGILGVIQENPLGDLEKFRENWADPNFTIEL